MKKLSDYISEAEQHLAEKSAQIGNRNAAKDHKAAKFTLSPNDSNEDDPYKVGVRSSHVLRAFNASDKPLGMAMVSVGGSRADVSYAEVGAAHRGKGVYSDMLKHLNTTHDIVSDRGQNLSPHAAKAYQRLGAEPNHTGDGYVLQRVQKKKDY